MAKKKSGSQVPIGEQLRVRRIDELRKGLREMAALLDISPAHLTDIEKGNRSPSEDLLLRISARYGMDESHLRAAWLKADSVVDRIATKNSTTARRVPELLRTAQDMSDEEWERLIKSARRITGQPDVGEESR